MGGIKNGRRDTAAKYKEVECMQVGFYWGFKGIKVVIIMEGYIG